MKTSDTGNDVWVYQVYASRVASGNPTGIVLCKDDWTREEMQRLAVRVGYPDTGFVTIRGGDIRMLSFSPAEELAFCSQTTLALGAMLDQTSVIGEWTQVQIGTAAGPVTLEKASAPGRYWVHLTIPEDLTLTDSAALCQVLNLEQGEAGPQLVIGFGRKRAYLSVSSSERLYSLAPTPEAVMLYCRANAVNGICLFVEEAGVLKVRIFTTSLSGAEDASTGGAVAALPLYLDYVRGDEREVAWAVDQGSGPPSKRGRLYVKRMKGAGRVAIGGDTVPTCSGVLSAEARREIGGSGQ